MRVGSQDKDFVLPQPQKPRGLGGGIYRNECNVAYSPRHGRQEDRLLLSLVSNINIPCTGLNIAKYLLVQDIHYFLT